MRWGWLVTGAALAMTGCNCDPPPVTCDEAIVTFETPEAGATVDSPFEVRAVAKLADGTAFAFDQASLQVGDRTVDGTVSGNRVTFAGVTASPGEVSFTATIAAGSCTKASAAQTVTVRDTCTTPAVTAVSFPQDTGAPLGILNRAELPPGTFVQARVVATCVGDGAQVRITRNGTAVSPLTNFVNGVAVVTTTLPESDSARYDLFAELVRNGQVLNTLAANPGAGASIEVNRAVPSCAITTTGSFGPMDDADATTAGFQMRVTGTMAQGNTGTLGITGATPTAVSPSMTGDVSADFTLTMSGAYTATLTCTDAALNTNTVTGMFTVDFDPPTLVITSPANVDGGATAPVTQSPLVVTADTNAENGSLAEVFVNGSSVGTSTVMNGSVSLQVPFGADGTYTVEVRVRDAAGNETRRTLTLQVTLDGCGAIFSRPGSCPALITNAQLLNGAYAFQTTSKPACANQPAALFRSDVLVDGGVTVEVASGTTNLNASGQASFAPLTLTTGDYVFRGVVTNVGTDAGVSSATCTVTVDLDGPVITSPVVSGASTFVTINAAQDTQPGVPGVQRVLTFTGRVPTGGRTDVCTTQAVDPVTSQNRPTSPECGAGWYVLQQGVTSPSNGFTFPEGRYDIKTVIVGGGLATAPASAALPVLVDSVRPCVNGISRALPQDLNGDSRLNIAELGSAAPTLTFSLGCGDTSPMTLATTGAVVVRDVVGGAARASTATFANGTYTVTLGGPFTTEVNLDIYVELTDQAGNRNQLAAMNDPATFVFRVDPVAPNCTVTSPSAALLGSAQVPGGNLDVIISTSADVGMNGVSATFTGQPARPLTPALNQAQTTYALTGDATYSIGATCTDLSGNATTATPRSTRVDLVAPTCDITSPANNATSATNDVTTTVAVTGIDPGTTVTITSSLTGISNNLLTVAGSTATGAVRYPNGAQTITASVSDAAGNACVASSGGARQVQLTVNSTSCNLDFVANGAVVTSPNGSFVNRVSAGNAGGTSPASVTIGAVTSDCGAGRNVYLYPGAPSATPGGTPQVTNASGQVSFTGVSVSDGQQWTVTIDNGAGIVSHRSFLVSFAAPTVASIGLQRSATNAAVIAVAPNAALTFGAASGNRRVETAIATDLVFGDLDAAAADAQFQLTLGAIDGARVAGLNATLEFFEGTTALTTPIVVNATPFTASVPRLRLTHRADDAASTLVIRVTSPAGNVFVSTHAVTVDVIAPAAPAVTATLGSARAATVNLGWSPVYDDGADAASGGLTGGSPSAGYDLRWTTSSVPSNNGMAAEADYFAATSRAEGLVAWQAGAINNPLSVPPLNTYYVGVRARDEVGNYSAWTAPSTVANPWTTAVITGAVASSSFGASVMSTTLVGNDTANDLVVTATGRGGVGSVYVYSNALLATSQAGCPSGCQELTPSDTTAGAFGSDLSVGNVGAVGAEVRPDLVVGQTHTGTTGGRAVLYFGTTAATLTTSDAIEFRGDSTTRIGQTVRIIRDITGDGRDEIAIAAPTFSANRGRVFIYRGRDRADWLTIRTSTDATTMVPYIPVGTANADYVIDGPSPLLVSPAGNTFGQNRRGLISVNDLDGDTFPDVAIPTSRGSINRYRVYGSATIKTSTGAAPLDGTSSYRLEVTETAIADNSNLAGVGTAAVANVDVFDSTAADMVVSYPGPGGGGQLLLYSALAAPSTPTVNPSMYQRLTGPLTFGASVAVGRVDSNTSGDILASTGLTSGNSVWLLYQLTSGLYESGTFGVAPSFWVTRFDATTITGNANSRLGAACVLTDVSGDGAVDVVLGDSQVGEVRLWR